MLVKLQETAQVDTDLKSRDHNHATKLSELDGL